MTPDKELRPGMAAADRAHRSFIATNLFLRKQLWIWPVLAAVLLLSIGLWVRGAIEESQKADLTDDLTSILNADVEALDIWMKAQRSNATSAADDVMIGKLARELVTLASRAETTPAELVQAPTQAELRRALKPWLEAHGYSGFFVADKTQKIVASSYDDLIGKEAIESFAGFVERALEGRSTVSHPFPSVVLVPDEQGRLRAGVPTMFAAAPLRACARGRVRGRVEAGVPDGLHGDLLHGSALTRDVRA